MMFARVMLTELLLMVVESVRAIAAAAGAARIIGRLGRASSVAARRGLQQLFAFANLVLVSSVGG